MKILIAPDSFKGSLTATEAAAAMAAGARAVYPDADIVSVPLADGGEGTVDAWLRACGGRRENRQVTGPLGESMTAAFGILADGVTAVVETAAASGLTLVPPARRNPLDTTTYGTGELIHHAIDSGMRRLVVGLGGSATNDGGAGALQALGVTFLGSAGVALLSPITGGMIDSIDALKVNVKPTANLEVVIASDVMNPLTGPTGASAVFGPQKGATPDMVAHLDAALTKLASIYRRDLGVDILNVPGGGAAGGLGAALMAFFNARAQSGIDLILDAAHFDEAAADADYIITGEGSIDSQTLSGKAVAGVVNRCHKIGNASVIAIGGVVDMSVAVELERAGVTAIEAASPPGMRVEEAMARASELVEAATERALSSLQEIRV